MLWVLLAILGLSILSLLVIFFTKYGQLVDGSFSRVRVNTITPPHHESLSAFVRKKISSLFRKLWHFLLEAKDLMPATGRSIQHQAERVRNVFKIRIRASESDPQWLPEAQQLSVQTVTPQNPEEQYLAAIKRDPNDTHAYEALGRLYLENKNYKEAGETYEFLIKSHPQRDIYYSNLGLAYYSLGEYRKAVAAYEQALKLNSKVPTRWINLSLCFDALDDSSKTMKALLQALSLDKLNINYLMMLADTYLKIPNNVRAEEVLEQILMLEPTNKTAREKLMKIKI